MDIKQAQQELVARLADDRGLLTAGDADSCNTMTIAWGETGCLWWKPVVSAYVVPSRHTFGFMQDGDCFTVSLLPREFRGDLELLGSMSGRDGDKVALTKLTPKPLEHGVTFEEADLTIVCRKLYEQPMDTGAIPADVANEFYRTMGVHSRFIGEIIDAF